MKDIFKVFLNSKSTKDREVEAFYSTAYMWKWEDIAANLSKYDADFTDQCRRNSVEIGNRCIDFRLSNPLKIPRAPMEDKKPTLLFDNYDYINKYLNSKYLEDRFLLYMDDGNMVYLTLTKFKMINYYNTVVERLENRKGILYLDNGNHFQIKE